MAHTSDGFRAFDNACPHQSEALSKGRLTQFNEVVCPLHHYRFSVKSGQESRNRCRPMNIYKVEQRDAGLFLEI